MCSQIQESGLIEIIPLAYISAMWGKHPVLSHPERLLQYTVGVHAATDS